MLSRSSHCKAFGIPYADVSLMDGGRLLFTAAPVLISLPSSRKNVLCPQTSAVPYRWFTCSITQSLFTTEDQLILSFTLSLPSVSLCPATSNVEVTSFGVAGFKVLLAFPHQFISSFRWWCRLLYVTLASPAITLLKNWFRCRSRNGMSICA